MPRTSNVESPGCPPLRVLTTDVLGLVKVVEARGKNGTPKVVETWGSPDASQGVVVASLVDHKTEPLLAIGRKNGSVELLNPLTGDVLESFLIQEAILAAETDKNDPIVGLHLFNRKRSESLSRLSMLLMCTENGKACLRSFRLGDTLEGSCSADSPNFWNVCSAGKILCSSLDAKGNYALFGGKGIEVNVWDLDKCQKIWTTKSVRVCTVIYFISEVYAAHSFCLVSSKPPRNSLDIFTPTWFTAAIFLSKEDHRKIVAGTNDHQVRLYDIAAQRRPVFSVDFRESSIKALAEDGDGYTVYVGTGSGDLASFDMRTGKLLGCFIGKCCGSIRSIARHPEFPVIASCGLDSYVRFWDTTTRKLLSAVFLKQHLTNVVIDSHFSDEEITVNPILKECDSQLHNREEDQDEDELPQKKKLFKEKKRSKKAKTKKSGVENHSHTNVCVFDDGIEDHGELSALKQNEPPQMSEADRRKKSKRKKSMLTTLDS